MPSSPPYASRSRRVRERDPQGVKGAFLYTAKMLRNGTEYTLEILVREADWTILHFLYK